MCCVSGNSISPNGHRTDLISCLLAHEQNGAATEVFVSYERAACAQSGFAHNIMGRQGRLSHVEPAIVTDCCFFWLQSSVVFDKPWPKSNITHAGDVALRVVPPPHPLNPSAIGLVWTPLMVIVIWIQKSNLHMQLPSCCSLSGRREYVGWIA